MKNDRFMEKLWTIPPAFGKAFLSRRQSEGDFLPNEQSPEDFDDW